MTTCHSCGSPLGDGDRFCATCGTEVLKREPEGCSACDAPMAPTDRFCPACGTPALPPAGGPSPPMPAAAPAAVPPAAAAVAPAQHRRLPAAGWLLILFTAWTGFDLFQVALTNGVQWPEGDPLATPLAAGFMTAIVLNLLTWTAIIGLLFRGRWAFGLAVLATTGTVLLRGLVFVWLVVAILSTLGDDAISSVLSEILPGLFWIYGLAEVLVLAALLLSRNAFRRRLA